MKGYRWICSCEKNPLNNLFPNGEYTITKPIFGFAWEGKCRVCKCTVKMEEFEI